MSIRSPLLRTIFSAARKSTTSPTTVSIPNMLDVHPKKVSLMKSTTPSSESASPVAMMPRMWLLSTLSWNSLDVSLSVSWST